MHLTAKVLRPSAVRCIRPPSALGFPTQLPGEVLMAIISWKNIFCCLIYGKSAINLWKPGLFQKLFTYGCHENAQGEQMTLKTFCSSPSCTVWQKNQCLHITMAMCHTFLCSMFGKGTFDLWKKALVKSCLHMVAITLCGGNKRGQRTRVENQIHFGMHCVGKQCLGIAMATLYNNVYIYFIKTSLGR